MRQPAQVEEEERVATVAQSYGLWWTKRIQVNLFAAVVVIVVVYDRPKQTFDVLSDRVGNNLCASEHTGCCSPHKPNKPRSMIEIWFKILILVD